VGYTRTCMRHSSRANTSAKKYWKIEPPPTGGFAQSPSTPRFEIKEKRKP